MSKRGNGQFKGHCLMCAMNKGKVKCDGQSHRKPYPEKRFVGRLRRLARHDLGDHTEGT